MRVLVGYESEERSGAIIADLSRAGLPPDTSLRLITIQDLLIEAPVTVHSATELSFASLPPAIVGASARTEAAQYTAKAISTARQAADHLHEMFPGWTIEAEGYTDSPAGRLLTEAQQWKADLLIVGAHGESKFERLLLGSVSQTIVSHAGCPVRIARRPSRQSTEPVRLLIGVDGSPSSTEAVSAVARRPWPAGSEAMLMAMHDTRIRAAIVAAASKEPAAAEREHDNAGAQLEQFLATHAAELRDAGLAVQTTIRDGNPKHLLMKEAEAWQADCIFVGAKGRTGLERILLGSVALATAARAPCSVEVVRPLAW